MAAPTSYTEATLATFMVSTLGSVATDLVLTTTSPSILVAITAVERLLGVTDVASATDVVLVETAAAWKAWQAAYGAAVTKPDDLRAGSAELKWADRLDGLRESMTLAEGVYYTAVAVSSGSSSFAFAVLPGSRGR